MTTCKLNQANPVVHIAETLRAFLDGHPEWRAGRPDLPLGRLRGPGVRLSPFHDGTDGFLIARLEKA